MIKHLLLLALLSSSAYGIGLEDLKGPLENKELHVPEATTVPYAIYQFVSEAEGVTAYRVSGDFPGISISTEGWLYLTEPLHWFEDATYPLQIEALADDVTVDGPFDVVLKVVDVNNNAPTFDQDLYAGQVMEHTPAGVPFLDVSASDVDDPNSANAALMYSIVREIPSTSDTRLFQIDPQTGKISTTEAGAKLLRAREGLMYSRGEQHGNSEVLKKKFDDYCTPVHEIPYEQNPFFTCVLNRESRHVGGPVESDYTLIVRAQDMNGAPNGLSGTTRVDVVIRQNLWVNPGPITIRENLKMEYPMLIATVTSNDPNAIYSLVQKERLNFPFSINPAGEIFVTEELDREDKDMYVLVVFAKDEQDVEVDSPMEIHVIVSDENDNAPECGVTEFEVQENEIVGSLVGNLMAHDADEENSNNALLSYTLEEQLPATDMFSVDIYSGNILVTRSGFRRAVTPQYSLTITVSDAGIPAKTVKCPVIVKVIDINNELPIFDQNDYGKVSVEENAEPGSVLLKVKATDADDPGTGSSQVLYLIAGGDPNGVFTITADASTGEGILSLAKPLDYEEVPTYELQIHARNPEPLVAGLNYGEESTAVVTVDVSNVDEPPVFDKEFLTVNVPENLTVGATVMYITAHDPEGKELMFKMEGDERGWLEIDSTTGELKTKSALDYEEVQHLTVKVVAYEKDAPEMQVEKEVDIHLIDVNDNVPKLKETHTFICAKNPKKPVRLEAEDADAEPYGAPFTFSFGNRNQRSQNWEITPEDATSAWLTLKKVPLTDQTFGVPINVKDNAGMGVTHRFDVRICNCTDEGFCFVEPRTQEGIWSLGSTIGLLGGILGFGIILFVIVMKRSAKKKKPTNEDEGTAMM